jgi:polysaccharide deacetylase 2 family uncharacterized protein YibQ
VIRKRTGLWPVLFVCTVLVWMPVAADSGPLNRGAPAVAIIIDDLGKQMAPGRRAIALPGPVACSFLPREPHTTRLAEVAHRNGKEVLLHLPMESIDGRRLDAGAVTLDMTHAEFSRTVRSNLARVPYAIGINNHMGSLLTRHPGHMFWLMREMLHRQPMYFVDSRTTVATVARQVAQENGVPSIDRNVFLDNQANDREIAYQFKRLVQLARKQGTALAIGHPHPETLAVLEREIPKLGQQGLQLVAVSELIALQQQGEQTWQASWSPSHKGAKN